MGFVSECRGSETQALSHSEDEESTGALITITSGRAKFLKVSNGHDFSRVSGSGRR